MQETDIDIYTDIKQRDRLVDAVGSEKKDNGECKKKIGLYLNVNYCNGKAPKSRHIFSGDVK